METEKLYYADPFLTDFTATVLDCQPGKNGYLVTLNRTAPLLRSTNIWAARIGPIVWLLDGP